MDNYKEVAERNLVEMKTQEEKANKKVILVVIVFVIMLLFTWYAGGDIGKDLGRFIYNISH